MPLYGLYIDPFWNFDEKVGVFVPNKGLRNTIESLRFHNSDEDGNV